MPRRKRSGRKGTGLEGTATSSDSFEKLAQELAQQIARLQEALHMQEQKIESKIHETLHLQEQSAATALHELERQVQERDHDIRTLQQELQETQERMTAVEEGIIFSDASGQYETLQRLRDRVEKTEAFLRSALETFLPRMESVLSTLEKPVLCTRKLSNYSCALTDGVCRSSPSEGGREAGAQEELSPPEEPISSSSPSVTNTCTVMSNEEESVGSLEICTPGLLPASSTSDSSACRTAATGKEAADTMKSSSKELPRNSSSNPAPIACRVMGTREEATGVQEELSSPEVPDPSSSASVINCCTVMTNGGEMTSILEEFSTPGLLPASSSSTSDFSASRTAGTEGEAADSMKISPRELPCTSSSITVTRACTVKDMRREAACTQETLLTPVVPHHYSSSSLASCSCQTLPTEEAATGVAEDSDTPTVLAFSSPFNSSTINSIATSSGETAAVLEESPPPGYSHASSSFAYSASACRMTSYEQELPHVQETIPLPGLHNPSNSIASACKLLPAEEETSGIIEDVSPPHVPDTSSFPFTDSACTSTAAGGAAVGGVQARSTTDLEAATDEEVEERARQQVEMKVREVTLKMEEVRSSPCALGEQLWVAAGEGKLSDVRRLLDVGAPVNYIGRDGLTPLLRAACLGNDADVVSLLLVRGADCNAVNTYGCSALHFAVSKDRSGRSVDLLIGAGAAVNARNKAGVTPLHWAASRNNASALRALLVAGARKDLRGWSGGWKNKTPLDLARSAVVRSLLCQRHPE